jgi:hypothetical protein
MFTFGTHMLLRWKGHRYAEKLSSRKDDKLWEDSFCCSVSAEPRLSPVICHCRGVSISFFSGPRANQPLQHTIAHYPCACFCSKVGVQLTSLAFPPPFRDGRPFWGNRRLNSQLPQCALAIGHHDIGVNDTP